MSSVLVSTVAGAISTLLGHMQDVAANQLDLDLSVFLGPPTDQVNGNYLMLGNYPDGLEFITNYHSPRSVLGIEKAHNEDYQLVGHIRSWSGSADPNDVLTTINNAFAIVNDLAGRIEDDWNGSGALSTAGSWSVSEITQPESGPLGDLGGWGIIITFTVQVVNGWIEPQES
jgi:hypothetical protein